MTKSPSWLVVLEPYGQLLTQSAAIPFWTFLVMGVVSGVLSFYDGRLDSPTWSFVLMVPCVLCLWVTGPVYFFSAQSTWDILPDMRPRMANLLVMSVMGFGLVTLVLMAMAIAATLRAPAPSGFGFMSFLMVPAMTAGLAKAGLGEVLWKLKRSKDGKKLERLGTVLICLPAAMYFAGLAGWDIALCFVLTGIHLVVGTWGAWLMRRPRHRDPIKVPPLLVGSVTGQTGAFAQGAGEQSSEARPGWAFMVYGLGKEIARAKKTGRRLWFVDLETLPALASKIGILTFLTICSMWTSVWANRYSNMVSSPIIVFMCVLISVMLVQQNKSHPWLFLGTLPVSRKQMAWDLTRSAMRMAAVDIVIILLISAAVSWVMHQLFPTPEVTSDVNTVLVGNVAVDPRSNPHPTGWDIGAYVGMMAWAFALIRAFIFMEIKGSVGKLIIAAVAYLAGSIGVVMLWRMMTQLPQPVSATAWVGLIAVTAIVWGWAFRFYHSLWLTAQFDEMGAQFRPGKAWKKTMGLTGEAGG